MFFLKSRLLYFFAVFAAVAAIPASALIPVEESDCIRIILPDNTVCETDIENYTALVVAAEYGVTDDPEVLKALAVTVRSAAVYVRANGLNHREADFCSLPDCCFPVADPKTADPKAIAAAEKSVSETKGVTLLCGGRPAMALYTVCSYNGTRDCGRFPQITGVKLDRECGIHIKEKLAAAEDFAPLQAEGDFCLVNDENGFCELCVIGGKVFSAAKIASLLGLSSERISAKPVSESEALFICKGVGNGYGLDLCYASVMAASGSDYKEILKKFFPEYDYSSG